MPASAGRVKMPANNRVATGQALQTHGIWQTAIGFDPHAPEGGGSDGGAAASNAYEAQKGLFALARLSGATQEEVRGSCKKCNGFGHLAFQCRNFLKADVEGAEISSTSSEESSSDEDSSDGEVRGRSTSPRKRERSRSRSPRVDEKKSKKKKRSKSEKKDKKDKKEKKDKKDKKDKKKKSKKKNKRSKSEKKSRKD